MNEWGSIMNRVQRYCQYQFLEAFLYSRMFSSVIWGRNLVEPRLSEKINSVYSRLREWRGVCEWFPWYLVNIYSKTARTTIDVCNKSKKTGCIFLLIDWRLSSKTAWEKTVFSRLLKRVILEMIVCPPRLHVSDNCMFLVMYSFAYNLQFAYYDNV